MLHRWIACLTEATEDEQGQGLVEYALILLFVAVAAIATLTIFGTTVSDLIDVAAGAFPRAPVWPRSRFRKLDLDPVHRSRRLTQTEGLAAKPSAIALRQRTSTRGGETYAEQPYRLPIGGFHRRQGA
jgi:Flp pilus assembly pilin Flp